MAELSNKEANTEPSNPGGAFQDLQDFSSTFKVPTNVPTHSDRLKAAVNMPYQATRDDLTFTPSFDELKKFAADFKLPTKDSGDPGSAPSAAVRTQDETRLDKSGPLDPGSCKTE